MSFEPVVRPFQDRPIAPPVLILPDPQSAKVSEPKAMSFGGDGGTTFQWSYSFSGSTQEPTTEWKETKRESTTVRITNPDDPDQFVETKRANKIQFNDVKTGKQKRVLNFTYPDLAVG